MLLPPASISSGQGGVCSRSFLPPRFVPAEMEQSPRRFVLPRSFLPPRLVQAKVEQSPPCLAPPAPIQRQASHAMTLHTSDQPPIPISFHTTHSSTLPSGPKNIPSYRRSKSPPSAPSHTPISNSIQSYPLPPTHINHPPSLLPLTPPLLHHTHGLYQAALGSHTGHTSLLFVPLLTM